MRQVHVGNLTAAEPLDGRVKTSCSTAAVRSNDHSEPVTFLQRMSMAQDSARLPSLDLLAGFEAAARRLSFTLAAEERFVTQSAISRQVKALEDDLGVPLFVRGHRALRLTADGERLQRSCRAVFDELRATVAHIRGRERRELLSLTTTPGLASLWLIPRLSTFAAAHPGLDVRIDAGLQARDLEREGIDVAIRYTTLPPARGEALFGERLLPLCSPALLRRGPALRDVADLARHTLIDLAPAPRGDMPTEWQTWLRSAGAPELEPATWLSFNSYNEAIAAAQAGQGVVLGRRPLVDTLLRSRRLVAPLAGERRSERGYVLLLAEGARQRPAVQTLAAWLREQAAGTAAAPVRTARGGRRAAKG
jgi:DNA-binding transcriptional LysR family regulator